MSAMPPVPKTKPERDAMFAKMFTGITPAEQKTPTMVELLTPYHAQLVALRKAGYSVQQIVDRLKQPPLSIDVSRSTLNLVIGGAAAKRRAKLRKLAAQRAANLATNAAPAGK